VTTIQASTNLPAGITIREGRCPPHWIARAVYEEYAGWFHQDLTSELYTTPQSAIWPELVDAMGGSERVAERALEVHEAAPGGGSVVSPAPRGFDN